MDEQEAEEQESALRRSTRESRAPVNLNPSMRGQSYDSPPQMHLQVPEEEAETYTVDMAKYAVMLLQSLREKINKKPNKPELQQHLVNYSLQKGLKKFKEKGYEAALGKMKQLHDRDCWTPIKMQSMSQSEKNKALESLIFLVEKKDGRVKARHCANGSKQRQWMRPDEAASPTVMTESVLQKMRR